MNKRLQLLALAMALCSSTCITAGIAARVAAFQQAGDEIGQALRVDAIATLAVPIAAVAAYNGLPCLAAQHLWYMTKSHETLVGEARFMMDRINDRYATAFEATKETADASKLSKMKAAAAQFQKNYRAMDAGALERFHSKHTAVYNKLEQYPVVFLYRNARYDLSWVTWYMDRIGSGEIKDKLTQVAAQLEGLMAYLQTTETYLAERTLIKQETQYFAWNIPAMIEKPCKITASIVAGAVCAAFIAAVRGNGPARRGAYRD